MGKQSKLVRKEDSGLDRGGSRADGASRGCVLEGEVRCGSCDAGGFVLGIVSVRSKVAWGR